MLRMAVALCVVGLSLSSSGYSAAKPMPLVVVSIRPLALLVQDICQEACQIQSLIPLGQSEHHWEPGPKQIASTKLAVAAVGIGLGLDELWFKRTLQPGKDGKKIEPILIGKDINPVPWKHADAKSDDDHDHGRFDPHVWFDPIRMSQAVPLIVKGLSQAIPSAAKVIEANGERAKQKLGFLQNDIVKLRSDWRDEPVLVLHDALGYWAARYQLKTLSLMGDGASDHQISAKAMAKTIKEFKANPPLAIVVEREDGTAKNLAKELKVPLVVFDLAGGVDKQSYYDWLLHLARDWDGFAKKTATGK